MIRNVTRKRLLADDAQLFTSSFAKGLGLMLRFRAPKWTVIFPFNSPRKVGIHMFFVFFPLDIIWLDENKRVIEAKTMSPWTMYTPTRKASWVLELPAGTIKQSKTILGDKITFL